MTRISTGRGNYLAFDDVECRQMFSTEPTVPARFAPPQRVVP